ncbi:calcium-binding and coiled-coil domain-containing protein 1-like [Brachionichthys hirsutus]|uniref:calcium-binding and coiled-coil domain-containing protein 1-like n=1 Tax=Brachionichthys hirsutus TaxID=412623 RepID=UPI003604C718
MDEQPAVVFRNVGQHYFPQTRVECHYSLSQSHRWSSSDWIGIFEVGWSSVERYYTYTWALVPEGHADGADANCCVIFHASYLPRPSAAEYEFMYVDKTGQVCARSRPFVFCAPKPLEELETLKEERDEDDDDEEELLLVIPKAQLLQRRLEESWEKQEEMQKALDATRKEMEDGEEKRKKEKREWEFERGALKEEISELGDNVRQNYQSLKKIEGKHKDVKYSKENLSWELSKRMAEKAESLQQIRDLEENVEMLTEREKDGNAELERLKERVKKLSCQMKHDDEKRKSLQVENDSALVELQELQERLGASERAAESLRRELRELGARQGHTHTELHQARLQVAQLTLRLSEENLLLQEEHANWAREREASKHAAETEKKKWQELICEAQRTEEWLQEERTEREKLEVELGNERDSNRLLLEELQEARSSLRRAQRERDEQQGRSQELVGYVLQLEQRSGLAPGAGSSDDVPACVFTGSSSEDDDDTSSASPRSSRFLLFPSTGGDSPAPDTQDVRTPPREDGAGKGTRLILPETADPVLSERMDSPMW